jgi:hypothetical protein
MANFREYRYYCWDEPNLAKLGAPRHGTRHSMKGALHMPFSFTNSRGNAYILHQRTTQLKNGNSQTIYFFGKEAKEGAIDAVPEGYEVAESKNGLPVLKRANKESAA